MLMIRFEHIEYLYALLLIPLFIGLFIAYVYWKRKALHRFGQSRVIQPLMPLMSGSKKTYKFILLIVAYIFIVLAAANPQIGSKLETVQRKGIDLIIALDVSSSMLAEDIRPDRLSRSKQAIAKLIDKLSGDRIGIVVFAGKAYTQLPITSDYAAAKMFLSTINPNIVPVQGTAIGEAIKLATKSFKDDDHTKAIVIITDGENHEGDALDASKKAAEQGISVYTIGMGLKEGAPIPEYNQYKQLVGYKKDKQGNPVISKLDETMLQQIASAGNGAFIMANNQRDGLSKVLDEIGKLEKTEFETKMFTDYEDRFQYFLAFAIFFLVLEFVLFERKLRWVNRIKMFSR